MGNQQESLMKKKNVNIPLELKGFDYGYLIGVLYGDGSISHYKGVARTFRLTAIDADFCKMFSDSCKSVFGFFPSTKFYKVKPNKVVPQGGAAYQVDLYSVTAAEYLDRTFNKETLPDLKDQEFTRGFLTGLLDSEGFCCRVKRYDKHEYRLGLSMKSSWLPDLGKVFGRFGVVASSSKTLYKRSYGTFHYYTLTINKASFAKSGLRFNIARKNAALDLFIKERSSTTARILASRKMKQKIQSDLLGNLQKVAEMPTSPVFHPQK